MSQSRRRRPGAEGTSRVTGHLRDYCPGLQGPPCHIEGRLLNNSNEQLRGPFHFHTVVVHGPCEEGILPPAAEEIKVPRYRSSPNLTARQRNKFMFDIQFGASSAVPLTFSSPEPSEMSRALERYSDRRPQTWPTSHPSRGRRAKVVLPGR